MRHGLFMDLPNIINFVFYSVIFQNFVIQFVETISIFYFFDIFVKELDDQEYSQKNKMKRQPLIFCHSEP